MKLKKIVVMAAAMVALFFLLPVSANAAKTVPKVMRGTWYFQPKYYKQRYPSMSIYRFYTHGIRRGFETESQTSKGSYSKLMHHFTQKLSINGHHAKRYSGYSFDIDTAYFPYKMKIGGKYQRVILATQEQGSGFAVYTHFMPAKTYTVPVHVY